MTSDSTTVIKNMEFLVKELHKEWDRSGANKASVFISLNEVEDVNRTILLRISKKQKEAENSKVCLELRKNVEILSGTINAPSD